MTCTELDQCIDAYIDCALCLQQIERIYQHLAGCAPCREHFTLYRMTVSLVQQTARERHALGGQTND